MFSLTKIATDPAKEANGVWRDYKDGSQLLIARTGNPNYRSMLKRLVKSQRSVIDNDDDLADKVGDKIFAKVMAETILLDWRGIAGPDGTELKYTSALGTEVLSDPANRDFREAVKNYADDAEAYRRQVEAVAVGNSEVL